MSASEKTARGHRKRLKDRFRKSSLEGFHDYEALELLLTYAIPRRDVKPLAKELIRRFGGLKGVFEARVDALQEVRGVGESAALLLTLLKEMGAAYLKETPNGKNSIHSPEDALSYVNAAPIDRDSEGFHAVYLNSKNEVLGVKKLHEGGLKGMKASPRAVIESAFKHNARSIIFVHYIPAGKIYPTEAERRLSKELHDAATAIDILVHDHLIVGKDEHFSARKSGWLKGR